MKKEILLMVRSLSDEKQVPEELIFQAVESALAAAAANQYSDDVFIRVAINRETGDYETFRYWIVTEDIDEFEDFPEKYILLETALKENPQAKLTTGDIIEETIESVDLLKGSAHSRIAAQQAKQIIMTKVREAERQKIESRYEKRVGELVNGVVKKVTRDHAVLDMGDMAEGIILKEDMIPREVIRNGDRLRGYLYAVHGDKRGPQLLISRTHPQMLIELFRIEVPEIGEQVVEIKAAARDPGSRAKIAVKTNDGRIDPVGACVGMRGARVQAVSRELFEERIDIVLWDANPAQFVINSLAPAEVASIMADEETKTMDVAVREDQLSQAIGRNGQNVRLASELTGWKLNVMSESEAVEKHTAEAEHIQQSFMKDLGIDENLANLLVQEGYTTLEEIGFSSEAELAALPGLNKETAVELQNQVRDVLLAKELEAQLSGPEPAEDLLALPGMTEELAYNLLGHGIVTQEDLANQAVDELTEIGLDETQAAELIMAARAPWFEDED